MAQQEFLDAHRELLNWGRWARDQWPAPDLGYVPPATSQEYRAPNPSDGSESDGIPVDETAAAITEAIVVQIGLSSIDHYRVLVRWYPKLMAGPPVPLDECYKRLAKHMHCSYDGARRMREESVRLYWTMRRQGRRSAA